MKPIPIIVEEENRRWRMKCYFVECEESCPVCGGSGAVEHPAWTQYWDDNGGKSLPTPQDDERWFREQGYDETPDEIISCDECDGRGVLVSRVPLAEALADLVMDWQRIGAIITGNSEEGADE